MASVLHTAGVSILFSKVPLLFAVSNTSFNNRLCVASSASAFPPLPVLPLRDIVFVLLCSFMCTFDVAGAFCCLFFTSKLIVDGFAGELDSGFVLGFSCSSSYFVVLILFLY
eukprot:985121_1